MRLFRKKGKSKRSRNKIKIEAATTTPMAQVGGALFERLMLKDPDPRRRKFLAMFLRTYQLMSGDHLDQIERIMEVLIGREELKKIPDPAGVA